MAKVERLGTGSDSRSDRLGRAVVSTGAQGRLGAESAGANKDWQSLLLPLGLVDTLRPAADRTGLAVGAREQYLGLRFGEDE